MGEDRYVIVNVTIKLKNDPDEIESSYHERKSRYGSLQEELQKIAKEPYKIEDAFNAVINMRKRRLPQLEEYGSAGSFFRNPVVSVKKFKELSEKISELQSYPVEKLSYEKKDWKEVDGVDFVKIPAGRLLDELKWRDRWIGNAGVSPTHALCIVTNKKATGKEVLAVAEQMKKEVLENFGVELHSEVKVVK
jgi:UDP-N-acetylmuramate dehydrogenase